jgi:viroplasmin and RNaseH domain-containing protein
MTWYVVYCGHQTGVFSSWRECHASVNGFKGACYKGYKTEEEALAAYHNQKGAQVPVDQVSVDCKDIKKLDKTIFSTKDIIIIVQFIIILVLLYKLI